MLGCGEACFLSFYICAVEGVVWSWCRKGVLWLPEDFRSLIPRLRMMTLRPLPHPSIRTPAPRLTLSRKENPGAALSWVSSDNGVGDARRVRRRGVGHSNYGGSWARFLLDMVWCNDARGTINQ